MCNVLHYSGSRAHDPNGHNAGRVCMFYVLPMTPGTAQSWRGSLFRKPCRRYHASGWSAYPYTMTRHTRTLARFVPSERVQQRKRNDTPNTQRKSHRRRVSHLQRHAVRFRFLRLQYIRATVHMLSVCPSMTTAHPKADTLARHDPNSVRVSSVPERLTCCVPSVGMCNVECSLFYGSQLARLTIPERLADD